MSERSISIIETPGGIVVDLYPGLHTVPLISKDPTQKDPRILVDLGNVAGRMSPLKVYYPSSYSVDQIIEKADLLFEKTEHCPQCERKGRELIQKFQEYKERRDALMQSLQGTEFGRKLVEKLPPLPEPKVEAPPVRAATPAPQTEKPPLERMQDNILKAGQEVQKTLVQLLTPPKIDWPCFGCERRA